MVRTYKKKVNSRNYKSTYSAAMLAEALDKVKNGEMTLRKASALYQIPRGTLSNRLNKKHSGVPGHPSVFSEAEENSFVAHIAAVADWGFPFTTLDMRFLAKCYLDSCSRTVTCFKQNFPSPEWASSFIKRHAQHLRHRLCQNIKQARAEVSPDMINNYFDNLTSSLKNDDDTFPDPDCIFNYDETNLTDDPGVKKCVFRRGVKYAERVCDSTKSSTSVMFCGSASGTVLPPYVVYKAEHLWDRWMEGGPKGARYNRSKSGWFDSVTFSDWFQSIFLPHTRRFNKKVFLIGDNLASHFTEQVVKSAAEHNVAFICLPKNSTHLCQPLDVAFYRPLKRSWRKILDEWKTTGVATKSKTVTKEAFPGLLKQLCVSLCSDGANDADSSDTLISDALIAGFRKCGIFPLCRKEVLNRLPQSLVDQNPCQLTTPTKKVADSVITVLKTMRYGSSEPKTRKKRSRIDVQPGCSISWEELVGSENTPTTSGTSTSGSTGHPSAKRRRLLDEALQDDGDLSIEDQEELASLESDSGSDLEPNADAFTSTGMECTATSNSSKATPEDVENGSDAVKEASTRYLSAGAGDNLNVGEYAIIQFAVGKTFRFYVGEITKLEGNEYEVSCFRQSKIQNQFYCPNVPDISLIAKSQVYALLPKPKPGRRGLMSFPNLQDIFQNINMQ